MTQHMTPRVKEILSYYSSENPGTLTNLARLMMHGRLAGTGRMVILPVDQGFEHGPARSFAPNPAGYDPDYHFQLAIDAGCNAYAAPLGSLEASASKFAGQVPMILKLNNSDSLAKMDQPISALTGSVEDALRLGCVGIGYTISGPVTNTATVTYVGDPNPGNNSASTTITLGLTPSPQWLAWTSIFSVCVWPFCGCCTEPRQWTIPSVRVRIEVVGTGGASASSLSSSPASRRAASSSSSRRT
mgnify:CR=1 FL=1